MKARPAHLLSLLAAFLTAVAGQSEDNGTHSTSFDPKYYLPNSLLINPKTHPGLFSFTGRWLLSPARPIHPQGQVYQSTLWPGNSVTVLVHGSEISVRVIPKPQGWIEDYHFYVSVDGGDDMRYSIPPFNSSQLTKSGEAQAFDVVIHRLGEISTEEEGEGDHDIVLEPHTIRLTSVPETPLSFEGLDVPTALIRQGNEWIEEQDRRISIEFVGEGSDARRKGGFFSNVESAGQKNSDIWRHSVQYRVGETLGVRHSHISAGTCLLTSCKDGDRTLPGLFDQYFQTSPFALQDSKPDSEIDPHHNSHLNTPYRFPEFSSNPQVPTPPVNFVVVDLGVLDVLVYHQNPDDYAHTLLLFLARLRSQAHPTAKILVIARDNEYIASFPGLYAFKAIPKLGDLRKKLYTATRSAVALLQETGEENIHLAPLPVTVSSEENGYLHVICPFLLPPPSVLSKLSMNKFGRTGAWSRPQKVCLEFWGNEYSRKLNTGAWRGVLVIIGLAGLWMARSTVVGAMAAICGRARLGMEAVEAERGLLNGGDKRGEDYDKSG